MGSSKEWGGLPNYTYFINAIIARLTIKPWGWSRGQRLPCNRFVTNNRLQFDTQINYIFYRAVRHDGETGLTLACFNVTGKCCIFPKTFPPAHQNAASQHTSPLRCRIKVTPRLDKSQQKYRANARICAPKYFILYKAVPDFQH
jgi:hypothetical protein